MIKLFKRFFHSKVETGDQAPDFSLSSHEGKTVRLSDFLGKKCVVLYFYPKDDTYGCIAESCSFRDHYEVFKEKGAEVIGISSDSPESHLRFIQKYKLPFTLLSDQSNQVRRLYGVPSTMGVIPGRVTFVIDKKGTVQHVFNSQFNPKSHVEQALMILRECNPC
ncbi:MAG: Thiol-disulfide oxidoreductase ResA [Elusimicrobia bacterium]|nr:Thiol-disulfide oxidoreductase ResA [Elusimicrobiota bacterium]